MTKVAVYGFIRIVFDLLGVAALVVGHGRARARRRHRRHGHPVCDAAARSEEAARLLDGREHRRRSSPGSASRSPSGRTACATPRRSPRPRRCFTCFNHAIFKSLLFFGAGAVLNATGERNIEKLGGLIHRMPHTAFAFLVGCVAISALPPLNGFVSEWLTFQAILLSPELPQWGLKFTVPAAGALLALSAALAAACFVRAFGVTFLGRPRTPVAERARGDRPLLARRDVRVRGALPRSPASCPASSSTASRRRFRASSAPACRCRSPRPGSRSCR